MQTPDLPTEAKEEMQLRTITKWCNKHIGVEQRINNLEEDFWDGTKFSALVETLLQKGNFILGIFLSLKRRLMTIYMLH